MRSKRMLWSGGIAGVVILCLLALSACNLPGGAATPTQVSPDVYFTQAAETIDANLTMTASANPLPHLRRCRRLGRLRSHQRSHRLSRLHRHSR